jgi:spermidine synthase
MAYATVDELAAALRIRVSAENTATLQACLDAAATEINHVVDWRPEVQPLIAQMLPPPPLLNRVNVLRGVEWFKSNDAAFGVIGFDQTGALQAPRNGFRRHAATLIPFKQQWGVA